MGGTALRAQLMRRKPVAALLDDAGPHRAADCAALSARSTLPHSASARSSAPASS